MHRTTKYDLKRYCSTFQPEHGTYTVTTRPPIILLNPELSKLRHDREHLISIEAEKAARLKCHDTSRAFNACLQARPAGSSSDVCSIQYSNFKTCLAQEQAIEKDKRRRDIDRFNDDWWTSSYSREGEVGEQATHQDNPLLEGSLDFAHGMLDSFRGIISGS